MAEDSQKPTTDSKPAGKTVTIHRVQIGLNVVIQVIVVILIVGMVNYISFKHFKRWDYTRDQKHVLSGQTTQLLGSLKKPVKAVVFFSTGSEVYGDVVGLLREYEYAAKTQFQTELVDQYRNFTRARSLQEQYKFGANENLVILDYGGKTKFVKADEMAEMDQSGMMMGQPPTLKSFKGEQAITSALLELTEEKQNKIYLLAGHGEPELTKGPIDEAAGGPETIIKLRTFIERQNIKAETLKLGDVDKVPDDARAILIIAPKYDLSEREMKLVREYWEKKGRLFISLDPTHPLPRLAAFFDDNGIRPQDDRVLRTLPLSAGVVAIVREVAAMIMPGSPITKRIEGVGTQFAGATQSIYIDTQRAQPLGINVTSLIQAADGYWGETDYSGGESAPVYPDLKKDHQKPLSLAVSVEKGALADKRVSVETARMVVVGNGDFLRDNALTESGLDFALSGFNWMLNREELIGIAPKERKSFTLNLTEEQMSKIFAAVVLGIPGLVALFGVFSWWQRRN